MYFIAKGDCIVMVRDMQENDNIVKKIGPSDFFGEIALLSGGARTATVKSENYCTIGHLSKEYFTQMLH